VDSVSACAGGVITAIYLKSAAPSARATPYVVRAYKHWAKEHFVCGR